MSPAVYSASAARLNPWYLAEVVGSDMASTATRGARHTTKSYLGCCCNWALRVPVPTCEPHTYGCSFCSSDPEWLALKKLRHAKRSAAHITEASWNLMMRHACSFILKKPARMTCFAGVTKGAEFQSLASSSCGGHEWCSSRQEDFPED
ncbi:uncharacterized protein LOC119184943 [Rhipicephalus microplus]|uniref:uncharacterized protein LOC119184943 n=1 Tax=Rhipicephalus microplus TaxID=6941 RepID=UPI003F6C2D23